MKVSHDVNRTHTNHKFFAIDTNGELRTTTTKKGSHTHTQQIKFKIMSNFCPFFIIICQFHFIVPQQQQKKGPFKSVIKFSKQKSRKKFQKKPKNKKDLRNKKTTRL